MFFIHTGIDKITVQMDRATTVKLAPIPLSFSGAKRILNKR